MYQLNFPNGNVQTYNSQGELMTAARLLGGEAKLISGKTYAFVPKKKFVRARSLGALPLLKICILYGKKTHCCWLIT